MNSVLGRSVGVGLARGELNGLETAGDGMCVLRFSEIRMLRLRFRKPLIALPRNLLLFKT